jgi:hypothetical protein
MGSSSFIESSGASVAPHLLDRQTNERLNAAQEEAPFF